MMKKQNFYVYAHMKPQYNKTEQETDFFPKLKPVLLGSKVSIDQISFKATIRLLPSNMYVLFAFLE